MDRLFELSDPTAPLTLALVGGMALSRGLDFLSTWIVTPHLTLEANPLMRRVSWGRMALLNLPLLGLPLLHHGLAVTFVVTSLLVAGSNLANGALALGMGEARHLKAQQAALRRIGLGAALGMNTSGMAVVALGGGVVMLLTGGREELAWWGGLGVVMFGVTGLVHLNWAMVRIHRHLREGERKRRAEARKAWAR